MTDLHHTHGGTDAPECTTCTSSRNYKEGTTMLETEKFTRIEFDVEAVRVTAQNAEAVAEWCKGTVKTDTDGRVMVDPAIHKPQSQRLAYARIGDWVVYAGSQYRVYTPRAFEKSFKSKGVTVSHPTPDTDRPAKGAAQLVAVLTEGENAEVLPDGTASVGPFKAPSVLQEQPVKVSGAPSPAFLAALAKSKNGARS